MESVLKATLILALFFISESSAQNQTQSQNVCATNNGGCDPNANCIQLAGARTCTCKIGFVGTGLACSDVLTCSKNNGGCHVNANCVNILGSVKCNCKPGFTGDGKACVPKPRSTAQNQTPKPNLCLTNNGGCDLNAICINALGSAKCNCKAGFTGDGKTCTPKVPRSPAQNQAQSQPHSQTQSQNLCATNNGGCDPNANCVQLGGARTCTCKIGFVGTGLVCSDVLTCSKNNGGCHANANCVNILGSVKCNCKPGFTGDGMTCTPRAG